MTCQNNGDYRAYYPQQQLKFKKNQLHEVHHVDRNTCCWAVDWSDVYSRCPLMKARVYAQSACGNSAPSDVAEYASLYKPSAPICYDGDYNKDTGEIKLFWEQPFDDGCAQILDYRVYWKKDLCDQDRVCDDCNINEYRILRTDADLSQNYLQLLDLDFFPILQEGEMYSFVIQARNAWGYGDFSEHVILPSECADTQTNGANKDDWRFDTWNNIRDLDRESVNVEVEDAFEAEDGCSWDNRECEFQECDAERHIYGDATCWIEHCWNDCGRYECQEWHATSRDEQGEWQWLTNDCP